MSVQATTDYQRLLQETHVSDTDVNCLITTIAKIFAGCTPPVIGFSIGGVPGLVAGIGADVLIGLICYKKCNS